MALVYTRRVQDLLGRMGVVGFGEQPALEQAVEHGREGCVAQSTDVVGHVPGTERVDLIVGESRCGRHQPGR